MMLKRLIGKPLRHNTQTGSILLELLVVMVIVSVVMVGMITSFGNISRGQAKADRRLEATQYAIEGMEAMYNLSRNDMNNLSGEWYLVDLMAGESFVWLKPEEADYNDVFSIPSPPGPQEISGNGTYFRTLSFVYDGGGTDMILVESTVCWDAGCSASDQSKQVTFTSRFVRRPL
jgi:type II secretory pathway pseudopilin PulG